MSTMHRAYLLASLLVSIAACGNSGGDDGAGPDGNMDDCPTEGRYLPLAEGNSWTYRVVTDTTGVKTQTVGAEEDVGGMHAGTVAFKLTTAKPGGGETISWQQDTGDMIVRLAEADLVGVTTSREDYTATVAPNGRIRVDETAAHTVEGASWQQEYTEHVSENGGAVTTTLKTETWTVMGVNEFVTVPAGEFCTLHLRRTSTAGGIDGSDKAYWFARGVGKVQEVSAGQTETLTDFTLQ
jgi:hypothetical protein